jgi:hypothetical protein
MTPQTDSTPIQSLTQSDGIGMPHTEHIFLLSGAVDSQETAAAQAALCGG